ncbi:hypothetical protein LJC42_00435 [Eubacteriales bacterium OttesenSCG-928-K08]|nr:hypothetical protein [Eubacteriales bacterium OttesenSCG-928-K08]
MPSNTETFQGGHSCYYHSGSLVVGTCDICGKNLCRECFDETQGICPQCVTDVFKEKRRERIKNLVIDGIFTVLIFLSIMLNSLLLDVSYIPVYVFVFSVLISGWLTINRFRRWRQTEVISISIIGIFIKLMISLPVGVFTPVILVYDIVLLLMGR